MSNSALRPGTALGSYPERNDPMPNCLDRAALALTSGWRRGESSAHGLRDFVRDVGTQERVLDGMDPSDLRARGEWLRRELHQHGLARHLVVQSFTLIREVARRELDMKPFEVQLMGGYLLLNGVLAEMETGEGKTLTATLPACTAALAGIPVHVVTVNDYLVERDAELMAPVYHSLGLSVGTVRGLDTDPEARRSAYACDVTYVTNKQVAFDYLRDRLIRGDRRARIRRELDHFSEGTSNRPRLMLRGLCFAIVDEADSVLVDEARTPLILSRTADTRDLERTCRDALALAAKLEAGRDYQLDRQDRDVRLTEPGRTRLAELAVPLGGVWAGDRRRQELARQALRAQLLFLRDDHYLVRDGQVQIIDPHTGRVMPDRSWEAGLHQMIEAREGCEITGQRETLARISYQQFYRRYLRLAGMTGTAREVARELSSVYGLRTVAVPTRRPVKRRAYAHRVFLTAEAKWRAIVSRIEELHRQGRPVLVGTRSVASSEHLSRLLDGARLQHELLNARQDQREAKIIRQAGERGNITIATSMAGRGSDIRLGAGVDALGGLHVIVAERGEARRIDRQLVGRCGRQGDSGSYEVMASLEDEIVQNGGLETLRGLVARGIGSEGGLGQRLGQRLVRFAQRAAERRHARARRALLKMEGVIEHALAFAGPAE